MPRDFTEQLTEGQAYAEFPPQTLNNGATANASTGAINMSIMRRVRLICSLGAINASSLINASIVQSNTQNGTYTAINCPTTNPALTGVNTANTPVSIEVRADQLGAGMSWVKGLVAETASHDAPVHGFLIADCSSQSPGNQEDDVTWTSKVVAQ